MTEAELVTVTREDRETFIVIGLNEGWSSARDEDEEIRDGQYDDDLTMQALARHRLAALASREAAAADKRQAEIVRWLRQNKGRLTYHSALLDQWRTLESAADAIESGSFRGEG